MIKNVRVVLLDDFAPFEFGLICEVFGVDRTAEGLPDLDFRVVAEHPGEPLSMAEIGTQLTPTHGLEALRDADLVAVSATRVRDEYPPAVLHSLQEAHGRGAVLLSVCSGAFLLGAAGLLDGRRCTTHWIHAAALAERFPDAKVDPDVLFVDEGDIITSAGTASGIDACLHLIRREFGSSAATAIARRMVVPPQRDGGQRQYIAKPLPEHTADSLQPLLVWMLENLDTDHTVATLAERANVSERTFARRFVAETGITPHRWLSIQRVLHARSLLEETGFGIEHIARVSGFGTAALLRHHFRQVVGVNPVDYRRSFSNRLDGDAATAVDAA